MRYISDLSLDELDKIGKDAVKAARDSDDAKLSSMFLSKLKTDDTSRSLGSFDNPSRDPVGAIQQKRSDTLVGPLNSKPMRPSGKRSA